MATNTPVDTVCINTVRALGAALPQKANSGHPGAPMGCAPMAHSLFGYVMNYSPKNPEWPNRDRFVLSNGHGCALHYTMLHLCGYIVSRDDLKNFRQLHSPTPGHPEVGITPGVEVTTGPLGQGVSQAVGMAAAAHHMAAKFNKPDGKLFDNYIYTLVGDGCLQEGVASEACSLAGTMKLGRLIVLYDSNHITIDGNTSISFAEDVARRFEAYGWHVQSVKDGDADYASIVKSLENARNEMSKPSIIVVNTTIGFGCSKQGTEKCHGSPIGEEDLIQFRKKAGLSEGMFDVADDVTKFYHSKASKGDEMAAKWHTELQQYKQKYPEDAAELERRLEGRLPEGWMEKLPKFTSESKAESTRSLSSTLLNVVAAMMPEVVGGSADLTHSNLTAIKGEENFTADTPLGRYYRFGVREHGMAAICNGLFAYGGMRPFCATFLNFITYAWGAIRISALSHFGVLYISTHDSIELGEDGPTHQPIEVAALCRATPNLLYLRPADGNEVSGAYAVWMMNRKTPTVMALCRGNVPHLQGTSVENVMKGGYILQDFASDKTGDKVILSGCGSELHLCVEAKELLEKEGFNVRIVSMPCWRLFEQQSAEYKDSVLPARRCSGVKAKVYVEAANALGSEKYFDATVSMTTFGASAPKKDVWKHFGFTKENIAQKAMDVARRACCCKKN